MTETGARQRTDAGWIDVKFDARAAMPGLPRMIGKANFL